MGSKLQLSCAPGNGSTFFFDLTLKTEQGPLEVWESLQSMKKVLIVDDNDNNRIILREMLLLKGIRSDEARTGLEALEIMAKGDKFDVILMDYHMPFMDGLEAIRKIRESFYQTRQDQAIILLSSSSDNEKVVKACEKLKVKQRLVKQVKMLEIYNALSRLHEKEAEHLPEEDSALQATARQLIILIAEDNAVNILLARTILNRIAPNAILHEAKNGLEAVNFCQKTLPDLIFMDVQMPEMNGYEATIKIREMEQEMRVPIIALTAGNVRRERDLALASGMDDFVVKPIVEEILSAVLTKWLPVGRKHGLPNSGKQTGEKAHFDREQIKEYVGDNSEMIRQVIALTISVSYTRLSLKKTDG